MEEQADKQWICEPCDYKAKNKFNFERHLKSEKHLRGGCCIRYNCDLCDYHTKQKGDWTDHLETEKHQEAYSYSKMTMIQKTFHHLKKAMNLKKEMNKIQKSIELLRRKIYPKGAIYLGNGRRFTPRERQWFGMIERIEEDEDGKDEERESHLEKAHDLVSKPMETLKLTQEYIYGSLYQCGEENETNILFNNWKQNLINFKTKGNYIKVSRKNKKLFCILPRDYSKNKGGSQPLVST